MLYAMGSSLPWSVGPSGDPWFRRRPGLALGVTAALFVVIFSLRIFVGDPVDGYSMFYVLPVALVAVAFGLRGGVTAGLVACALMVLWAVAKDVSLDPGGWLARIFPMLLLGSLLGDAADHLRRGEDERRRLQSAALLHREAIEINDSIVQGMAAAKWSLEAGRTEAGLRTLEDTLDDAQRLVSGLISRADMARHSEVRGQDPSVPDRRLGGVTAKADET